MIVIYDEHGGFFDHVSPPAIRTDPPTGISYRGFETLGVRVPAFIISPFVKPKTVFNRILDHTSILKFIGRKFGDGEGYSELVDKRPVGNVSDILNEPNLRSAVAVPSLTQYLEKQTPSVGYIPGTAPNTPNKNAFKKALDAIEDHPDRPNGKFDHLLASFSTKTEAA